VPLINEELQRKKGAKYRNSGVLHFDTWSIYTVPRSEGASKQGCLLDHDLRVGDSNFCLATLTWGYARSFLEYIAGGCEISLIVAVDFTASNRSASLGVGQRRTESHGARERRGEGR